MINTGNSYRQGVERAHSLTIALPSARVLTVARCIRIVSRISPCADIARSVSGAILLRSLHAPRAVLPFPGAGVVRTRRACESRSRAPCVCPVFEHYES